MTHADPRLADAIRRARLRGGFTQAELAARVGVSQGHVSSWETGRNEPSDEQLASLKDVLGRIRRARAGGDGQTHANRSRRTGNADAEVASELSATSASETVNGNSVSPLLTVAPKELTLRELESRLWAAADSLRGPVDPADFKAYIFPLLFFKWISDTWDMEHSEALQVYGDEVRDEEEADYHRFVMPDDCHWNDIRIATVNVGAKLGLILDRLQAANPTKLAGIFGDVAWGNKERLPEASLLNLINAFNTLTLNPKVVPHDVLGAAYEYLLKQFADASGKKAGEFFTPRAVVRLLVNILDPQPGESVYDPACGSGGMLVETIAEVRDKGGDPRTLKLYGQEVNLTTAAIARMNLYLHEIEDFQILRGDTLRDPLFRTSTGDLRRFDVVITNPPFSLANWGVDRWVGDVRAFAGIPPSSTGDFAWVQHMVYSMRQGTGRVGVVMPHGVLFRGGVEHKIRQKLVESGLLDAVIGLGPNLFYSTAIPACLMIFRGVSARREAGVRFVDASHSFAKGRKQNRLGDEDVDAIVKSYRVLDSDGSIGGVRWRSVQIAEIAENLWDLSLERYVGPSAARVESSADSCIALFAAKRAYEVADQALRHRLRAAGYE